MKKTGITDLAMWGDCVVLGEKNNIVCDIKTDSRAAGKGDLFVCIKGERADGHKYAQKAFEQGCRSFIMSEEEYAGALLNKNSGVSVILAGNTEKAFRRMAKAYISQFDIIKIAVTGSVGKTTTKDLTAKVMSSKYKTVCSPENHNSSWGLYLSCFLPDEETEAAVFEMGMDRPGEIEEYCDIVRPGCAILTNIGISHLEKLKSRENIAKTKLGITKYMESSMPFIYNSESDFTDEASLKLYTGGNYTARSVGFGADNYAFISGVENNASEGIEFFIALRDEPSPVRVRLPLLGEHNAIDASLAICAGKCFGIDGKSSAEALRAAFVSGNRLRAENAGGVYLIDDSYNASPDSMKAAIDVLMSVPAKRHIAILADMYELGSEEERGHYITGARAAAAGVDVLAAAGKNARLYIDGALDTSEEISVIKCSCTGSLWDIIKDIPKPGDAVLVKGSNSTEISRVAEYIRIEGNKNAWKV